MANFLVKEEVVIKGFRGNLNKSPMSCIKDERVGYLLDPLAFEVFDEEVFPDGQVDEVVVCESGSQHSEGPVEGASLEDPEADPSPLDPPPPLQELGQRLSISNHIIY